MHFIMLRNMHFRPWLGAVLLVALSACASGYTAENPNWIVRPAREEIATEYPGGAPAVGPSGRATLQCEVLGGGLLDHCHVLQQEPPGYAFAPPR